MEKKGQQIMKTYIVSITFRNDDYDDKDLFKITVPASVSRQDIEIAIQKKHDKLDESKNLRDGYDNWGRVPETLIGHVCKDRKWKWEYLIPDVDLELD